MAQRFVSGASLPAQTFRRLPAYHHYLRMLREDGVQTVSAAAMARDLRLGEVQVRKDMACISREGGRPRTGFAVEELIGGIEICLGYNRIDEAVLVGAGNLGRALLSYRGFEENGVRIVAAFDRDPALCGGSVHGRQVLPVEKLEELCRRMNIRIGIITVPGPQAQGVCDRLVSAGVEAVWNFAPVHLNVPDGVLLRSENMGAALAMLSQQLAAKGAKGDEA